MSKIMKAPPVVWWIEYGDDILHGEFHQEVIGWVASLGLDPENLAPQAAILYHADGYELHVDEMVNEFIGGRITHRFDPLNEDEVLTVRRIIPVVEGSWPARPIEVTV